MHKILDTYTRVQGYLMAMVKICAQVYYPRKKPLLVLLREYYILDMFYPQDYKVTKVVQVTHAETSKTRPPLPKKALISILNLDLDPTANGTMYGIGTQVFRCQGDRYFSERR